MKEGEVGSSHEEIGVLLALVGELATVGHYWLGNRTVTSYKVKKRRSQKCSDEEEEAGEGERTMVQANVAFLEQEVLEEGATELGRRRMSCCREGDWS